MASTPSPKHRPDGIAPLQEELDALFPTPSHIERRWLGRALCSVIEDVPWLAPLLGNPRLGRQLRTIQYKALIATPKRHRRAAVRALAGDHGLAGAIIGNGKPHQPAGLQILRGLLWLAMRYAKSSGAPFQSAAEDIAAPIRAAIRSPRSAAAAALGEPLAQLGNAKTLTAAIASLSLLLQGEHQSLILAWRDWLRPTLEKILKSSEPLPDPAPTGDPRKPRKPKPRPRPDDDEPAVLAPPKVIPLVRRTHHPDQLPDEPPAEFDTGTCLVLVPGYGSGTYSRARATYRASQAIWSGNHLLLTTHADALPIDVFGAALRSLVRHLLEENLNDSLARGLCGALLKAVIGRTTRGLAALRLSPPTAGAALEHGHLDLDAGLLILPPYWKLETSGSTSNQEASTPSYFRATTEQKTVLTPVTDQILLPLVRPIHEALTRYRSQLSTIAELDDLAVFDKEMAEAVSVIARDINVPIRIGNLRRSLGPLIVDLTGDPAVAQLICGESLGVTSAPQCYFAPQRGDLAAAYVSAIGQSFGESHAPSIPEPQLRVGSELLVSPAAAKAMARASHSHVPLVDDAGDGSAERRWHRRLLDHIVRMMMAAAGHRPAEALFEMTLGDIDLTSGAALFRDKRHDHAHDPRLACLPTLLCRQVEVYLSHLSSIAARVPNAAPTVARILAGDAPLLVDFIAGGEVVRPTMAATLARGPEAWRGLPANWGRTYLRTRGLELGGSAFLMASELGHYDAVGYPFSNQSPTDPVGVIEAVRPVLDRLIISQGWKLLTPEVQTAERTPGRIAGDRHVPLRDWTTQLAANERLAAESAARWERRLRTDVRRQRKEALAEVLMHPDVASAGIAEAFMTPDDAPVRASLAELDVPHIRQDLLVACGDDAAAAVARLRALRRVILRVAKRLGEAPPPLPIPIAIRRPLDNPFFCGACLALTQVEALRRHVRSRSATKSPGRDIIRQMARTAEALCLFGGIDDAPTVLELLGARGKAVASASIPDLLLVPLSDGHVIALRGTAALCFAALARGFPEAQAPSKTAIDSALTALLPAWANPSAEGQGHTLARLCSTVRVANRFELSPAARFAVDPERGCMPASLAEQIAYIDQDPVGPTREIPKEAANADPAPMRFAFQRRTERIPALRQYKHLLSLLPTPKKPLSLPLTGKTFRATALQREETRAAVISEIDAWLAAADQHGGERLSPIVHMLAAWTRAALKRRKRDGKLLGNRTVMTYLTRFANALVDALGETDAARWDGSEIESAYDEAIGTSNDAKHKVAAQLLSFHAFCDQRFDLPEVDLSVVYAHLKQRQRRIDAAMILPVERQQAIAAIAKAAEGDAGDDFHSTRVARVADFTMLCLAEGGARIGEPLGLQLRDLGVRSNGRLWTWLRPNRLRRMKTAAGRRVLHFDVHGDAAHHARALRWIDSIRRMAGARRPGATYVAQDADPCAFDDHPAVVRRIRSALALATGRRSERIHRLRHLVATERVTRTVLAPEDAAWAGTPLAEPLAGRPLQPRDLHAISVPLGQAHWVTTLGCYLHIPWLLQSRPAARLRERHFSRQTVAGALGYTPSALDDLSRGVRAKDPLTIWFDHFRVQRSQPQGIAYTSELDEATPKSMTASAHAAWTAEQLGSLVDQAWRSQDLFAALVVVGAPLFESDRIGHVAARWETKLGLRLLPEHVGDRRRDCPARAIRRLGDDASLEALWKRYDSGDTPTREALATIASEAFTYLAPTRDHRLLLPRETLETLARLLAEVGVTAEQLTIDLAPGGLAHVSIVRRTRQNPGMKGLGLKRVLAVIGMASALSR